MSNHDAGITFVRALFDYRCAVYEMTNAEIAAMKKVMSATARHLASQVEDPLKREFIEEIPEFRPSQAELHARSARELMSDPEMVKHAHDMAHMAEEDGHG